MDIDAYFKRLEIPKTEIRSLELINQLIVAHKDKIPFENLETYLYGRPADLDPDALFQKMILHKRGGYCFEQNSLFALFLGKLGYEVFSCICKLRSFEQIISHQGIIVHFMDEYYFCDVGYGGHSPSRAILIREGEYVVDGYKCKISSCGNNWWSVQYDRNAVTVYVCLQPWEAVDFTPINYFMTMNPGKFRDQLIVNRTMYNGYYSLHGDELTEHIDGNTKKSIISRSDRANILREKFNIVLNKESEKALLAK